MGPAILLVLWTRIQALKSHSLPFDVSFDESGKPVFPAWLSAPILEALHCPRASEES